MNKIIMMKARMITMSKLEELIAKKLAEQAKKEGKLAPQVNTINSASLQVKSGSGMRR